MRRTPGFWRPCAVECAQLAGLQDYRLQGYERQSGDLRDERPGRALVTGLCADVNRVKVPVLRDWLRAHLPPQQCCGESDELVNFYNVRFQMNLNQGRLRISSTS